MALILIQEINKFFEELFSRAGGYLDENDRNRQFYEYSKYSHYTLFIIHIFIT